MLQGVSELRWISILVYVDYLINLSKATQGDGIGTLTWHRFHLHLHWWEVQPGHLEVPEIIREVPIVTAEMVMMLWRVIEREARFAG
ncbi:tRNA dimethylallyltransferase [Clarias magur]|uniref:tRNA dimethylallyltransferase n=1 Tax=Clarias magur TaxID=1594786 RepID=A0A8J4XHL6_CLAMG|nr:tRNA dimethylallyltransferase [Clarias magur]